MDTRAQGGAIGIARLFLGLGAGAVVTFIVVEVTGPLFDRAQTSGSGEVATTSTGYLQQAVDFMPIAILLITFFGAIAYAIFSREVFPG